MHALNHPLQRGSFRQNWVLVMGSCSSGDGGWGVEVKCHLKKKEEYMPKRRGLKQHRVVMVIQVALEECKGVCVGQGDMGEPKMRLKRNAAEALSRGDGELSEDFQ